MNYQLVGHNRGNAVQDLLICLLPEEEHTRADHEAAGDLCRTTLETGPDGSLTARAFVRYRDCQTEGRWTEPAPPPGKTHFNRVASYAVKTALYQALLPHLPEAPVWGSLTGVKPAKVVRGLLTEGVNDAAAAAFLAERYFVAPSRAELCVAAARHTLAAEAALTPGELQLYVGIPFCPAKCAYCSFVSNDTKTSGHLIAPYLEVLHKEIDSAGQMVAARRLTIGSLYVGGGTPTILTASQLDALLAALEQAFDLGCCREITVEAGRPETIDADKLAVMAAHRVTRVNINPQTMNDAVLAGVGRHHTAADIERIYALARRAGDFAINMDLIAGLPGDSEESLADSVARLVALGPENITVHCLARKKGAPLRFGPQGRLPAEALDRCNRMLTKAGYGPYYLYRQKYIAGGLENVGWARGQTASFYNICMMEELCDILALGAGGVTKLGTRGGGVIRRVTNPKYPREYVARADEIAGGKAALAMPEAQGGL